MASIPGVRFDITGASGSQGLLTPKSGWRAIVFPRGGYAAADSTGVNITMDSNDAANRFAANNWVQVGLSTANIRQVTLVGAGTVRVNSAVTVSENDRIYLIGNTQPTVSGGSATYITPNTLIRQRDDDAADLYSNSMVTSNADGLVQFFGGPAYFDVLIQDGNQTNQGSIIDVACGAVEGISTSQVSLFGATVTVNAAFGVTGWATFGQTVTMNANAGVTGTFTVGATFTAHTNAGVTGTLTVGATLTTVGITSTSNISTSRDLFSRRLIATRGTTLTATGFTLSSTWGSTATISLVQTSYDTHGQIQITAGGAGIGVNPTVTLTFVDGAFAGVPIAMISLNSTDQDTVPWRVGCNTTQMIATFRGTPVAGQFFTINYLVIG